LALNFHVNSKFPVIAKYFQSPEKFAIFHEGIVKCDICHTVARCFDASFFYGENSLDAVCADCLSSGKLGDIDSSTCQGDIGELKRQLRFINPSLQPAEIDRIATEKTLELEKTTPPVITWQDWDWPCADGDYCNFIGYGSRVLYEKLATNGDGKKLFSDSIYYNQEDETDAEELWDESMSLHEINNNDEAEALGVLFYVFKSMKSNKIVTVWDLE
jgi:uncharacterized protein CbrC (UPF0167 family)